MDLTNKVYTINNGFLNNHTDKKIFFRSSILSNNIGNILIIHGFGEHSARYAYATYCLNKAGFNVYAFDLIGHGLSGSTRGFIKNIDDYVTCVEQMIELIKKNHPNEKIGLLGHSMGGLIAIFTVQKCFKDIYCLVLSNPLLKIKAMPSLYKHYLANVLAIINPYLLLASTVKPQYLSNNEQSNQEYAQDRLILKSVCIGWYRQICLALKKVQSLVLPLPTLMQLSVKDQIIDSVAAQDWFTNLEKKHDYELKTYENARHELYHEKEREIYVNHMIKWFKDHC